ncbi:hypothetical protein AQUCO_02600328v1 [Aquilegia coerulea]|uniref:Uncharacterized protein n=1 Tax=Aquilegia coerulea TaxID=218851 RepID=A0A2G5D8F3_AQUCA|nr:hypothetical protein AQUCO_02600328v1 [Aquilegia coerulea]
MALPYKVEVLEICQISPPLGSVSTTSIPLTFFDLPWLLVPPVQKLLYYELHQPKAYFMNTILPNLKHSLSITLQHFFPLTGRLSWPQDSAKPQILCMDNDSAPLIVAECHYDFHHLSDGKLIPLLALQVTLFPNKGICLGITFDHAALDGRSLHHFIKSWAAICKSQGGTDFMTDSLPFYDRTIVKDPNGFETINLKDLATFNITKETFNFLKKVPMVPVDKVRNSFVLSSSDIKKLKQQVLSLLDKDKQNVPIFNLSTFVLISAYVWICSIKARWETEKVINVRDCEDQREYFMFPVDCRARLNPPLPLTYSGTCVGGVFVKSDRNALIGENGIAIAAEVIGKGIIDADTEVWTVMEKGFRSYASIPPGQLLTIAGSPNFGIYETDFGWGKPKKSEASLTDSRGAIFFNNHPGEEGAVEILLVRDAIEMEAFASAFTNTLSPLGINC